MRRIYKNTRYGLLFFERKVSPRTSRKIRHFIFAKLLKFQETFLEKFLVSGFGAEAPTDNTHKKRGLHRVFYIVIMCWNCVPNLLLLLFFRRKVSKRTSHRIHHFILAKAFEFPKDFSRKVLWSGFGAEAPTDNAYKKHGVAVLFYICLICF